MKRMIFAQTNPAFVEMARRYARDRQIRTDTAPALSDLVEALRRDPELVAILWAGDGLHAVQQARVIRDNGARNLIFAILAPGNGGAQRALALNAGADECQTWPIDAGEFCERYWSICRRENDERTKTIRFGDLEFLSETGVVRSANGEVKLRAHESTLLSILASRPDQVVTFDTIMIEMYAHRPACDWPHPDVIKAFLCRIRQRLATASGGLDFIESVWGRGYRFYPAGFAPRMNASGERRLAG